VVVAAAPAPIKLEKTALGANKAVKKKKKKIAGNRVGFDRGADSDAMSPTPTTPTPAADKADDDTPAPITSAAPPLPPQQAPTVDNEGGSDEGEQGGGEKEEECQGKVGGDDEAMPGDASAGNGSSSVADALNAEEEEEKEETEPITNKAGPEPEPEPEPGPEPGPEPERQDEPQNERASTPTHAKTKPTVAQQQDIWKASTFLDASHASLVCKEFGALQGGILDCIARMQALWEDKAACGATQCEKTLLVTQLEARIAILEAEQEQLAEAEDFEGAHALSVQVESVQSELDATERLVTELSAKIDAVEAAMLEVREAAQKLLLGRMPKLTELSTVIGESYASTLATAEEAHRELERKKQDSDVEIQGLEAVLDEREASLTAQEEAIMAKVRGKATEVFEERDTLLKDQPVLEDEVAALEMALAAKKAELAVLNTRLGECNASIEEAKEEYKEDFSAVARDRATWVEESVTMDTECQKLKEYNLAVTNEIQSFQAENTLFKRKLAGFQTELEYVSQVTGGLKDAPLAQTPAQIATELDPEALGAWEAVAMSLAEKHEKRGELESELDYLESENGMLADRVDALDAEKKRHKAAKKFKEAGDVAKEQQGLLVEKKEVEGKISGVHEQVEEVKGEIAALVTQQKEHRLKMAAARKQADDQYQEQLQGRIAALESFLEQASSSSKGGDDDKDGEGEAQSEGGESEFSLCVPLARAELQCAHVEREAHELRYTSSSM
jgi:DNA repair exonuclease SbcCD ATPase subunit